MLWLALRFTALPDDPDEKADILTHLASRAYDYTPYIKRYAEDSLLLEVSRCLQLFGGIESLCQRLRASLNAILPRYQLGLAHTDKAAWLLSFQHHPIRDSDSQGVFMHRLQQVPLEHLIEHRSAIQKLQQMGFKQLGDIWRLPLPELGRRFGQDFMHYLQQIQGQGCSPPEIYQASEPFCRQVAFASPLDNIDQLILPARQLLEQLIDYLVRQQLQCQQICWRFYSPRGKQEEVVVACTRVHSRWDMLFELTRIRLERLTLNFEIDRLELECSCTVAVDLGNGALFQSSRSVQVRGRAEDLVARLQARLGKQAIYQVHLQMEYLPEYSQSLELPFGSMPVVQPAMGVRPCWLLARPQPVRKRCHGLYWHGSLELVRGPERIQGYWWNHPASRDYFVARRDDSVHCWIYQNLMDRHWYAHGIFA